MFSNLSRAFGPICERTIGDKPSGTGALKSPINRMALFSFVGVKISFALMRASLRKSLQALASLCKLSQAFVSYHKHLQVFAMLLQVVAKLFQ